VIQQLSSQGASMQPNLSGRRGARVPVGSAVLACHVAILAVLVAPALAPPWPMINLQAILWTEPSRPSVGESSTGAGASPGRECDEGIGYRVGGVAGLAVIGFGLHLLVTVAAILSERLGRLLRRERQPRRGQASRRSRPPTSNPAFDSLVDLRARIRSRRRRSRITFVSVLASAVAGILLMPLGVIVPFFFLFGFITLTVIALRDLSAADTPVGDGGVGPPLLFGFGRQVPVILGLLIVALNAVGGGLAFAYIAGGAVVCPGAGGANAMEGSIISIALLCAGSLLLRLARATATLRASELLSRDDRAPVLYLRSFKDDALRIWTDRAGRRTWLDRLTAPARERFEQVIAWHLWSYGPVVAISRPGSAGQPIGAAREELPAESWTRDIQEWLVAAQLIVMTVGRTEGVQWEVEQIRRLGLWPKVILLFPPVSDDELAIRWQEFRHVAIRHGGDPTHPAGLAGALAAIVSGDERTTAYVAASRDEWAYRIALEGSSRALSVSPAPWRLQATSDPAAADAIHHADRGTSSRPAGTEFFVLLNGEVVGPYGSIQLQRMAGRRQVSTRTLVRVGTGPWFPLRDVPGVFSDRSWARALTFSILGGGLGLDQFYLGNVGAGIGKLLTLGGLGAWWLLDVLLLLAHVTKDARGKPLR
jgi:hypothetical protein